MVGMSCVDITLSSLDNLEFYRPPWDDGYLMRKVTTLLTESEHTNLALMKSHQKAGNLLEG